MPGRVCRSILRPRSRPDYLRKLIDAGFRHIDAVSFVSPAAVPQMADSEQVLSQLSPPADVEIIGIVVNEKGAQRAIASRRRDRRSDFPIPSRRNFFVAISIRPWKNRWMYCSESRRIATDEDRNVVAYVSMAFGNPYGDAWSIDEVLQACDLIAECGITRDLAGGYRWSGHRRSDCRGAVDGDQGNSTASKSECICMRARRKRRSAFELHFKQDAGDSMPRSAASVVVRLRRMFWSEIFPRNSGGRTAQRWRKPAALDLWIALIEANNEISSRFGSVVQ